MEDYFSQISGGWPRWQMWGLLAGTYDDSPGFETGGIMFDAASVYGGAGEAPERQGFAVFRNHSWFDDLPAGTPVNDAQAAAARKFLHTWVHEAGHAFNFVHSWDKSRPDSLSWMNYDWRYDDRNGAASYFSAFRFRFDDEELIHLRHGDRASVIMGGDPWASGLHAGEPAGSMAQLEGQAPIELLVRSKGHFEFMEPVSVELRLRNLAEIPLELDTRLNPEDGGVAIYIRRPNGQVVRYAPLLCKLGTPRVTSLKPAKGAVPGEDRFSEEIFLGFGTPGFYFDEPGEYLLRAVYQGSGGVLIPSNTHCVRIGRPFSRNDERVAQDFFSHQVGVSLYLNGSRSPFLSDGMEVLESVVDRYKDSPLGARVAATLANAAAQRFFRIEDRKKKPVLTQKDKPDPARALDLTQSAVDLYRKATEPHLNLAYHDLVRQRAGCMVALGKSEEAKEEISALREDLSARGVNKPVLEDIKGYAESVGSGTRKSVTKKKKKKS